LNNNSAQAKPKLAYNPIKTTHWPDFRHFWSLVALTLRNLLLMDVITNDHNNFCKDHDIYILKYETL